MNSSLQWDNVIHRYGIGLRSDMDISQGVCKIIKHLQAECPQIIVGHDLAKHFSEPPLTYLFVNNKNIKGWSDDTFFNDALTECELTFYQNDDNTLRFRYFIQLTHGYLIHGISWVKSAQGVAYNSNVFKKVRDFVSEKFLIKPLESAENDTCTYRGKFRILDCQSTRVGTMFNTVVNGPRPTPLRLDSETMEKIEKLMVKALKFFKENEANINNLIK